MAIEWGAYEGGGNAIQVGIDSSWGDPGHGADSVTATVKYYTRNNFSWSDDQSLDLGGAIGGSVNFHNGSGDGTVVLRATRTYTYNYGNNEYGDSPGSRTFSATLHGAYNGITPSKSVTDKIPSRPIGSPARPDNCSATRTSDSSAKITWRNNDTAGEPYGSVIVERKAYSGPGYGGQDWVNAAVTVGDNALTDSGINPNRSYVYRVSAKNSQGTSGTSSSNDIWTTPATPTGCGRLTSGANQVISWTNNVAYNEYQTQVWRAQNGVWDANPIATVANGVSSYTHVAPAVAVQHSYRVRANRTSGSDLFSSYSGTTSPSSGTTFPPNAPTGLNPTSNEIDDPTTPTVLSWTHNPSADGSKQTSFMIQHRTGAGAWTTVPRQFQATSTYTLPPNTYVYSKTVEWQVMTWGSDGTGSPWSASSFYVTMDPVPRKYPVVLDLTSGRLEASSTGGSTGGGAAGTPVTMRRTTSTGQTIPDSAVTAVAFETLTDDMGGLNYVTATRGWTVPADGTYLLACGLQYLAATVTTNNRRDAQIQVNGSTIAVGGIHINDNAAITPTVATVKRLVAGDVVTFAAYTTGGARALSLSSAANWASVTKVDGIQGIQGLTGSQGLTGAQGAPGATGPQGTQGIQGIQGPTGVAGDNWFSQAGAPSGATGIVGDWSLDTSTGDVYEKTGGAAWTLRANIKGPQGPQGIQGPIGNTGSTGSQGPIGNTGSQGVAGTPGEKWFTQAGAPATGTGIVGDWALDSANGDYYEKTGAAAWTLRGNLRGPQGIQGPIGNTGTTGATGQAEAWWSGAGAPSGATGAVGDWYLNQTNGDVYEKTGASTWTVRANIAGPQGPTGSTGPAGPAGSGAGDVLGPASAVGDDIAVYNATTGKLLKDGGATIAQVRDRSTHTGTQAAATVTGLAAIATSGSANDLSAGTVPIARVPTGQSGTTVPLGNDARFTDARTPVAHVHAASDVSSGVLDVVRHGTTPVAGDYLKAPAATGSPDWVAPSQIKTDLVLVKGDVGLGSVDNTADASKPVSTAQQTALNLKIDLTQKAAASGVATLDAGTKVPIAQVPTGQTSVTVPLGNDARFTDARAPTAHTHPASDIASGVIDLSRLGTTPSATEYLKAGGATGSADWVPPSTIKTDLALTKTDVGLGNVDNTSDVNKPVSTAQQTAINAQMPTGTVVMWSTATAPPGWLLCNGTNYTYAAQPALAAVIGVIYGGVAGTNFNVPDMRMRLPIGHNPASTTSNYNTVGGSEGSLPDNSNTGREGRWQHTHQHDPNLPTADLNQTTNTNTQTVAGGGNRVVSLSGSVLGNHAHGGGLTSSSGVGGSATSNLAVHAYLTLEFIIKA